MIIKIKKCLGVGLVICIALNQVPAFALDNLIDPTLTTTTSTVAPESTQNSNLAQHLSQNSEPQDPFEAGPLSAAFVVAAQNNLANQLPTLNAVSDVTISEDSAMQTINLTGIAAGTDEIQPITVTAASNNSVLIANPTITYTSPDSTGTLTFTPIANQSGTATITVTVNDGETENNLITKTFTVIVNALNDAPILNELTNATVTQGQAATFTLSGADADSGDALSYAVSGLPLSVNSADVLNPTTGVFNWTPTTAGTHTLLFSAIDNHNLSSATRSITITVLPPVDPLTQGLVQHWMFDGEGQLGIGGNITRTNGPTLVEGKVGGALHFDGVDDYVRISNTGLSEMGDFTISTWIKMDASAGSEEHGNNPVLWIDAKNKIDIRPSGYFVLFGEGDPHVLQGANPSFASNIDRWVFIVVTRSGSTLSFYRNNDQGTLSLLERKTSPPPSVVNLSSFRIGNTSWTGPQHFNGAIDDFRIYDRSLSLDIANQLYALGAGDVVPPSIPTHLSARALSGNEVQLDWSPATDNVKIKGYKVFRATGNGAFSEIANLQDSAILPNGQGKISYQDNAGLIADTSYRYQIQAYDGADGNLGNTSANSAIATAVPTAPPTRVGNIIYANSGSEIHVRSAIGFAQDGDTVIIPEGTWAWTQTVVVDVRNRFIKIQGSGVGKTILLDNIDRSLGNNSATSESMFQVITALGKSFRITELEIQPGARTETYYGGAAIYVEGTSETVRIDHIKVGPLNNRAIQIRGSVLGVADHNEFNHKNQAFLFIQDGLFGKSWGDGSFENPVDWGGAGAFYVEDNIFSATSGYGGALDGWGGARVVFRNNTLNSRVTFHGTESSQRFRGGRSMEIYGNTFSATASNDTFIDLRSGTAVIFNNTITGTFSNSAIKLNAYRLTTSFQPWGIADGTKDWDTPNLTDDSNTPGGAGDGVFEAGVASSAGENLLSDSNKAWITNQWKNYTLRQTKDFTATSGGIRTVTVENANWTPGQWVGYEFTKSADNTKSVVLSSTANTITLKTDFGAVNMTGGGEFILSKAALITSNTATTLTTSSNFEGRKYVFVPGMSYEIRKVDQVLDQSGLGLTEPLVGSPPSHQNLNQAIEPIYEWNNVIGSGVTRKYSAPHTIKLNREYFVNTPKPGYTAYGDHFLANEIYWENLSTNPDVEAPSIPGTITASASSTSQIDLNWTPSTDNQSVAGYRVYRSSGNSGYIQIATITSGTTYSNTNLMEKINYSYKIKAYDAVGNESDFSEAISATTLAPQPVNTAPSISAIADQTIDEDDPNHLIINFLIGDGEANIESLALSMVSSNPTLIPDGNIVRGGSGTNRTITVTPAPNQSGIATITVTVNDGQIATQRVFNVTVNAVNDAPTLAIIDDVTLNEDATAQMLQLNGVGPGPDETQSLTVTAISSHPALTGAVTVDANNILRFTPETNTSGTATITITVNDGQPTNNLISRTFTVTINPINDVPTAIAPTIAAFNEDTSKTIVLAGEDIDGNPLTYSIVENPAHGTLVRDITDVVRKTYTYIPEDDYNGADSFTFKVNDGINDSPAVTILLNIDAVNDRPILNVIPAQSILSGEMLTLNLSGSDVDGNTLTYQLVGTMPANATLNAQTGFFNWAPTTPGTYILNFAANDPLLFSDTKDVTITVVPPPNQAPVATILTVSDFDEDTPQNIILAGTDKEGDTLTYSILDNPSHGTLNRDTFDTTGRTYIYTPAADYSGIDSFTFKVNDGTNDSLTETVWLNITAVNDVPALDAIANITLNEDAVAQAIQLAGISAGPGETQSLTVTALSSNAALTGTISVDANNILRFTPETNASGTATITITVNDGQPTNNLISRTFTVTINPVNDAPTAIAPIIASFSEDTSKTIVLAGADIDGNPLTYSIVENPAHGALLRDPSDATGRTYLYTPAANYNGTDSFTFKVSDGATDSLAATVNLNVTAVNDTPTLASISNVVTSEEAFSQRINLMGIGTGAINEAQTLTITAISNNTAVIPNPTIVYMNPNTTGTLIFGSAPNSNGSANITVTVSDGLTTIQRMFNIIVTAVNDAPTLDNISNVSVGEDALSQIINLTGIGTGALNETQTLFVSARSSNTALIENPRITYTSPNSTGTLTFTPLENQSGTAVITVMVNDGQVLDNFITKTFTVTVSPANDPPTITHMKDQAIQSGENTGEIAFTIGDAETATANLTVEGSSSNTTLIPTANIVIGGIGANRTITVTPAPNQSGIAKITVTVNDGQTATQQTFNIIVNAPTNEAPTLAIIENITLSENAGAQAIPLVGISAGSGEIQPLTIKTVSSHPALTGAITVDANNILRFTPKTNTSGTATITITVNDGQPTNNLISRTFTVTINPVNDAPTAIAPTVATFNEDTSKTIILAGEDIDGNPLTYSIVENPAHGTLVRDLSDATGRAYLYTPAANYNGTDSFTFKVSDGTNDSLAATISLNIGAVNDRPILNVIPAQSILSGEMLSLNLSGSDIDGNSLSYQLVGTMPTGATLNAQTGVFNWTPTTAGTYTLRFVSNDSLILSEPKDIVITVNQALPPNVQTSGDIDPSLELKRSNVTTLLGAPQISPISSDGGSSFRKITDDTYRLRSTPGVDSHAGIKIDFGTAGHDLSALPSINFGLQSAQYSQLQVEIIDVSGRKATFNVNNVTEVRQYYQFLISAASSSVDLTHVRSISILIPSQFLEALTTSGDIRLELRGLTA